LELTFTKKNFLNWKYYITIFFEITYTRCPKDSSLPTALPQNSLDPGDEDLANIVALQVQGIKNDLSVLEKKVLKFVINLKSSFELILSMFSLKTLALMLKKR